MFVPSGPRAIGVAFTVTKTDLAVGSGAVSILSQPVDGPFQAPRPIQHGKQSL